MNTLHMRAILIAQGVVSKDIVLLRIDAIA